VTPRLLFVALLGHAATSACAEQWLAEANAGSSAAYDTNPRLLSVGSEAVYGLITNASLDLSRRTEQSRLGLSPRFVARRYTGDYALDSDDIYLNADFVTGRGERSEYSIGASYSRDGTLTSEFVSTGFVPANTQREISGLRATASRSLSELTSVSGSVDYQDVQFEDGLRYGLQDYQYWSGLGYVQRSLSERTRVSLLARIGLLEASFTGDESQEVTVGLGLDRDWNERWTSSLYVGPTFSELNGRSSGTNTSFRVDVTGEWQRTTLRVQAERLLSPDAGRGQLESRDRASASVTYGLTEHLQASAVAAVDYFSQSSDPRNKGGDYRSYGRAAFGLVWRFSPQWSATARIEYAQRDDITDASRNSMIAGIEWRAQPRTLFH